MGTYRYSAKTASGEHVGGVMQADSELAVIRTLDERKLFPVGVVEEQPQSKGLRGGKVKLRDVGVFYGQLADLLRSGVPMLRSLEILTKATTNRKQRELVCAVRDDVAGGKTLAEAMGVHPHVFTPLHCAMVRAGEQASFLEEVLANLSQFLERQDDLRGKVQGALIYPAVLCIVGTLLMLVMLVALVPRFKPFFTGIELPGPTAFLFGLSDLLTNNLPLVIVLIVGVVVGVRGFLRSAAGARLYDRFRLRIPGLGTVFKMVSITRFCRILGTMLANGVPILRALEISKDATGCSTLSRNIENASEAVRQGQPLAGPLRASGLFPTQVVEMISVAEESNRLEKVLVEIADTVERRTNREVEQAVRLIEPLILVLMALAIGFVAVGLLYPIFTISQTIK